QLLFTADDGQTGRQLWVSDGTTNGTTRITGFEAPDAIDPASEAIGIGSHYFFVAKDALAGRELWVTDGTVAGVQRLTGIAPGTADAAISGLTNLNGTLF